MTLPLEDNAALVILESVTRILPLSETGHASLLELLANLAVSSELCSSVALGTWLAMIFLVPTIDGAVVRATARALRQQELARTLVGRDVRAVALGAMVMVLVELAVRDRVGSWGREPMLVGAGWLVTAAATASTLWSPRGSRDSITLAGALLVGAVEGAGILPGLSQPGLALACLLWLGVKPTSAFDICFLLLIPADAVLAFVRVRELRALMPWPHIPWMLLGLVVGLVALRVLRGALERRLLPAFSLYLVPLGVATIAWGYARP